MSQKDLVVVTGASSGIGAATAKLFSSMGHPLLLLARRVERMTALGLPNAMCVKCDITQLEEVTAAIASAEKQYGPVGCLVNNAGFMPLGQIEKQDPKDIEQMLHVNLTGIMNCYRAVITGMKERKKGTIVNVSSLAAHWAVPGMAAYCGTKAAVNLMMETCRMECSESNVRVCIVSPGATETELVGAANPPDVAEPFRKWIDAWIKAEDIADAIAYCYNAPYRVCIREIIVAPVQ